MKNGAQDYITKPFDIGDLVTNIQMVLRKRQLEITSRKSGKSWKARSGNSPGNSRSSSSTPSNRW
jgi:DNA-binding response OmpR family regulator